MSDYQAGYQIGLQCFSTLEGAMNYQMSQVVPSVTADGRLLHPIKQGSQWTFGGQVVMQTFPECDQAKDFRDGSALAGQIAILMVLAFGFRFLKNFIIRMTSYTEEKE